MNKIIFLSIFLLCSLFAFSSNMAVSVDNVSIEIPEGWIVQYTKEPQLFFLFAPNDDDFNENCNLMVGELPENYSVKEYMDISIEEIKSVYENLKVAKVKDNYYIISGLVQGISVKQMQFFYIKDNVGYILTFSSTPEDFYKYEKKFIEIASTFKY